MISSRNTGTVGSMSLTLAELRERLAGELEGELFGVRPLFEVYLNELEAAPSSEEDIRERCRQRVRESDIVLVLFDGRAGWSPQDTIGICHVEFAEAMAISPRKTRVIELPLAKLPARGAERERDEAFRAHYARLRPWAAVNLQTPDEIVRACQDALFAAVVQMAHADARGTLARGARDSGDALDWTRMNYQQRAGEMIATIQRALRRAGAGAVSAPASLDPNVLTERFLALPLGANHLLVHCHAIPAAMTVATAREMVGQPFLSDHLAVPLLQQRIVGPVHLIACARGVSEAQAIRQLGFPDATIVASSFGVYVADEVQKAQLVFLDNCRDETSTIGKVEDFLDWLERTGEAERLQARASSRGKIVRVIEAERR